MLVSADFLASDYCYDVEMRRAMERHQQDTARVIPVILRPCDWQGALFGELLAVPRDGKAVTTFPNQDEAFLDISRAIRKATEEREPPPALEPAVLAPRSSAAPPALVVPDIRSSNLRIKKTFSDRERDLFLEEGFEYIAKFFEGSITELQNRNSQIAASFRRLDATHFTVALYENGRTACQCKIWLDVRRSFSGGIAYSTSPDTGDTSMNDSLSVVDDGYALFLKPLGIAYYRSARTTEQMTYQGAAEYFWSNFIEPLQH